MEGMWSAVCQLTQQNKDVWGGRKNRHIVIFTICCVTNLNKYCEYKLNCLGNKIIKGYWLFSPLDGAKCSLSSEVIKNAIKNTEGRWINGKLYYIRWDRWCWQSFTLGKWFAVVKGGKIAIYDTALLNLRQIKYRDNIISRGLWGFASLQHVCWKCPAWSGSFMHLTVFSLSLKNKDNVHFYSLIYVLIVQFKHTVHRHSPKGTKQQ